MPQGEREGGIWAPSAFKVCLLPLISPEMEVFASGVVVLPSSELIVDQKLRSKVLSSPLLQNWKIRSLGDNCKNPSVKKALIHHISSLHRLFSGASRMGVQRRESFPLKGDSWKICACFVDRELTFWGHQRRSGDEEVTCSYTRCLVFAVAWPPAPWKHVSRRSGEYLQVRHPEDSVSPQYRPSEATHMLRQYRSCMFTRRGNAS